MVPLRAFVKVIHSHSMFHRPLLDVHDSFPSCLFHATFFYTKLTACDWNQETLLALLRQEDCCLAIWLNQLLSQVMSPRLASTSAVSTRRSTTPRGETASTPSTTTLPPQSQPPKTPTVSSSKRQSAVARSKYQQVW